METRLKSWSHDMRFSSQILTIQIEQVVTQNMQIDYHCRSHDSALKRRKIISVLPRLIHNLRNPDYRDRNCLLQASGR